MHREILGASKGIEVDHRDRDTLNNRRHNLRLATHSQNQQNAYLQSNNTSGFKGVSFRPSNGKWRVRIGVAGKRMHLGSYGTREEAYAVYCDAAKRHHGDFACV
jgi:hypothetical protein